MATNTEKLNQMKEKYAHVRKLVDDVSKTDPEDQPYKSKYEAKDVLKLLLTCVDGLVNDFVSPPETAGDGQNYPRVPLLIALFNYDIGMICVDTEEFSAGEEHLMKSLNILREHRKGTGCCLFLINVLNQLGILWSNREDYEKACEFLKEAEKAHADWIKEGEPLPLDFITLFTSDEAGQSTDHYQGIKNIDKAHTHTLYYLAQVYEHLDQNEKAAMYCHSTLKRQYESGDFDHIEWTLNCATLSQFFIANQDFCAGRHLLCCSDYVASSYDKLIHKEMSNFTHEEQENKLERLKHCKADVARCWIKYCSLLMAASQESLLVAATSPDGEEAEMQKLRDIAASTDNTTKQFLIRDDAIAELEKRILPRIVLDYEEAKSIFLAGLRWFKEAKEYYNLENYASDYVLVIQDGSKLYGLLSFFEPNADNQCKMHKRRIDMLEETLKALNPQFYLHACRALMFELGETHGVMMDIKLSLMEQGKKPAVQAAKKINTLAEKGISYFQKFLDTLKVNGKFPDKFADDVVRPALVAHFMIGRLYSKIISYEPSVQIQNLSKNQAAYMFVIDYVKNNPEHEAAISAEIGVIKEMAQLIPGKMQSIASNTMY